MYDYSFRLDERDDSEPIEPPEVIIARQRDAIQEMTLTILSLQAENRRLTRAIRELEREDASAVDGRVYDWNANVRAGGEYLE